MGTAYAVHTCEQECPVMGNTSRCSSKEMHAQETLCGWKQYFPLIIGRYYRQIITKINSVQVGHPDITA